MAVIWLRCACKRTEWYTMTWGVPHGVKERLVTYLYSSLNVQITEATVKRLKLGCTLSSLSQCQPMIDDMINSGCSDFIWKLLSSLAMTSSTSSTSHSSSPSHSHPPSSSSSSSLYNVFHCWWKKGAHLWSFSAYFLIVETINNYLARWHI